MRDLSRALAVASLACVIAACSFTTSGSGGPGSTAVASVTNLTPTDGHPSAPGEVDCNGSNATGGQSCTASQQACCSTGSNPGVCQSDSSSCSGWVFECDEALDCGSGEVCCQSGNTFSCQQGPCSGGAATQSCRLNAECSQGGVQGAQSGQSGQGGQCVVQDCNNGIFVELCALASGCTAQ